VTQPVLRIVHPDATPEEVAAILAAVGALTARPRTGAPETADDTLHEWVHSARLQSRRASMQRGPWRLSGRIGRRTRA
jgi:hypothetical protein